MTLDDFRAFEKYGLQTARPSTLEHCFLVVTYRHNVREVGSTRRASVVTRETRRRYWFFEQQRVGGCDDGAPLILRDEHVPDLHNFKDGVINQLKLEELLMGNRAAVRAFLNEEAVATSRNSTFMTEVLTQIVSMDIMPAVPGFTRDVINNVFRTKSLVECAQIVRKQIKLLVVSGDLD
jgi:hypothetical protein